MSGFLLLIYQENPNKAVGFELDLNKERLRNRLLNKIYFRF